MQNGARHAVGAVVGLIVTPLLAAALMFGTERFVRGFRYFVLDGTDRWIAGAVVLFVAAVLGVLAGSRVSPLASLIPGVVYFIVGLLWMVSPRFAMEHTMRKLPDTLDRGYLILGPYGFLLLVGGFLLVASLPRSRWAAGTPRRPSGPAAGPPYEFGGMAPPYGQVPSPGPGQSSGHAGPAAMGQAPGPHGQAPGQHAQAPGSHGQAPAPHGQAPSPHQAHGQPPAPYQPGPGTPPPAYSPPAYSPPPPAPSEQRPPARKDEGEDESEAGSWTQMYGTGGSDKDDRNS
ncbi:hypothetical protein [Actinomadura alba]|uniref:Uncharacterized protein n=1 Tax=Actinomadura alba TaxID=406431 RepID=A0ABR7LK23_9ACTN|nr:hypothetical protein [Actinomadura alba]MBC6464743.1 hypothetical protein [Actinomadura alba]